MSALARIIRPYLLAMVLVAPFTASAQFALMRADADELITRGTAHIYNTRFDSATVCFEKVNALYPDFPAGYFMEAMIDWWRMQIDQRNTSYAESFLRKVDKVVEVCDRILDTNEFDIAGLFFKGGILGYRGRYYASNSSWLKATNDARQALDILIKCNKLAPSNYDIMLGTGIYNYFADSLPNQYPALKPIMVFLPSGDKKLGVLQLEAAARNARYAAVEAKVVLQMVYGSQFEKQPAEYLRWSRDLYTSYPLNAFFHRKYAVALVMNGYSDSADVQWKGILDKYRQKVFGYDVYSAREALYYLGTFEFNRGNNESALQYLYKCDEASRYLDEDPSGFMVRLNMTIGKIYDLQGRRDLATSQYNKILSWSDYQNSHREAEQYLQEPYRR
jgi:tetratricopeptide (TPR) repeat protein